MKGSIQSNKMEQEYLKSYEEYSDSIFRFCLQKVGNRETALDLTQTTFLRAWRHLRAKKPVTHWRGFLYRIARNAIFDHYRKQGLQVKNELNLDESEIEIMDNSIDLEGDMNDVFLIEKIKENLDILNPNQRDIIVLRFLENCNIDDISIAMNITKNTVSVRIHRALEILKEKIIETEKTFYEK